jgi:sugar lactone lactonase YvrE
MPATPELTIDIECKVGEGPLWHPVEQVLYWVDIPGGTVYRHDPAVGGYDAVYRGPQTGGFTFQRDGGLLLFQEDGAIRYVRDGAVTTLRESIEGEVGNRFNDVATDPRGRVFCGTMNRESIPGKLYRLDGDGSLSIVFEDAGLSNGIGWSPDLQWMYHSDSLNQNVTRSRYNIETGEVRDRDVWFDLNRGEAVPDGLTVDADGNVWLAVWNDNALLKLDPDGHLNDEIRFPVRKVSSVTFGGPDLRTAWVTTACIDGRDTEGPGAGGVFRLDPGVQGRPEPLSEIRIG